MLTKLGVMESSAHAGKIIWVMSIAVKSPPLCPSEKKRLSDGDTPNSSFQLQSISASVRCLDQSGLLSSCLHNNTLDRSHAAVAACASDHFSHKACSLPFKWTWHRSSLLPLEQKCWAKIGPYTWWNNCPLRGGFLIRFPPFLKSLPL